MEMEQNVSVLSSKQKKYFSDSSTQTKKIFFRFPQYKQGILMTKSFLLFSAGRLFCQQKVGHGNGTKCFSSFIQTKKIFFRFLDPNKKNIFQIPAIQTRHFHDQILAVVFSWSIIFVSWLIVSSAEVGHGNEMKQNVSE